MILPDEDVLDLKILSSEKLRRGYREKFAGARPFKHLVFDNLFSESILDGILDEFKEVGAADWVHYDTANERKYGQRPNSRLGPASQAYISAIHSGLFVGFLTSITDIEGLLPDPTLSGGGLHEIPPGGKFAVHVDFNRHPVTRLDNRLVFITYLNRGWLPSFGSALELWSADEKQCVTEVQPIFGRSILFHQSQLSWHGHPTPVNTPDGRTRRSIAAYYYTNGREDTAHEGDHNTLFVRPIVRSKHEKSLAMLRSVTPPFIADLGKRLRSRLNR